jgi:hypothetical protein
MKIEALIIKLSYYKLLIVMMLKVMITLMLFAKKLFKVIVKMYLLYDKNEDSNK